MEHKYKIAYGRGAYYSLTIGALLEVVLAIPALIYYFYLGVGIVVFTIIMIWYCCKIYNSSYYEITDSEIVTCGFSCKKQTYPIDKISKICYVDTGTEWARNVPNARYQLEIYFDRKYLKSVMPLYFAPEDRDAFVKTLLHVNPDIIVNPEETRL